MGEKHELISSVIHSVGIRVDDLLERAKVEHAQCQGGQQVATETAKSLESLYTVLREALDKGEISAQDADRSKPYIERALVIGNSAVKRCVNMLTLAQGRVEGIEKTIELIKSMHEKAVFMGQRAEQPDPIAQSNVDLAERRAEAQVKHKKDKDGQNPGPNPRRQRRRRNRTRSTGV